MCGNPLTSLPKDLFKLNVEIMLVLGEQKHLKLTTDQIAWLKQKNEQGCKVWLACDDLVLGDVDQWKSSIQYRFYM